MGKQAQLPKYLGTAIRVRREMLGLFGKDMAVRLEMANGSYLSQVERNKETPTELFLSDAAKVLRTTTPRLIEFAKKIEQFQWR